MEENKDKKHENDPMETTKKRILSQFVGVVLILILKVIDSQRHSFNLIDKCKKESSFVKVSKLEEFF